MVSYKFPLFINYLCGVFIVVKVANLFGQVGRWVVDIRT